MNTTILYIILQTEAAVMFISWILLFCGLVIITGVKQVSHLGQTGLIQEVSARKLQYFWNYLLYNIACILGLWGILDAFRRKGYLRGGLHKRGNYWLDWNTCSKVYCYYLKFFENGSLSAKKLIFKGPFIVNYLQVCGKKKLKICNHAY